eukprot:72621-Pelagomonas_calceolata.AAC.2
MPMQRALDSILSLLHMQPSSDARFSPVAHPHRAALGLYHRLRLCPCPVCSSLPAHFVAGLSNIMRDGHFLKTSCGSPNYAAPEVGLLCCFCCAVRLLRSTVRRVVLCVCMLFNALMLRSLPLLCGRCASRAFVGWLQLMHKPTS